MVGSDSSVCRPLHLLHIVPLNDIAEVYEDQKT